VRAEAGDRRPPEGGVGAAAEGPLQDALARPQPLPEELGGLWRMDHREGTPEGFRLGVGQAGAGAEGLLERREGVGLPLALEEPRLTARAGLSHAEADALGRALAMVHPPRAAQLFAEWLRPRKGILQRTFGGGGPDATLRWAAVSGLGAHPSPAAVALLEDAAKSADEELRRHCLATLARRRGGGARHG